MMKYLQKLGKALMPVSYTHLDVYKRQVQLSVNSGVSAEMVL